MQEKSWLVGRKGCRTGMEKQCWNQNQIYVCIVVEMDPSLLGWGAVPEGIRMGGLWSEGERSHHTNLLELTAGEFAVKTFARHRRNTHMHLKMDNKTATFYINNKGRTRSHLLAHTANQLWQWCLQRGITLSADNLPGSSNIVADWVLSSLLISRVDTKQEDIHLDNGGPRPLSMGSVRNWTQPPVEPVFELEARPVWNGDRCLLYQLEGQRRIMPSHHLP